MCLTCTQITQHVVNTSAAWLDEIEELASLMADLENCYRHEVDEANKLRAEIDRLRAELAAGRRRLNRRVFAEMVAARQPPAEWDDSKERATHESP